MPYNTNPAWHGGARQKVSFWSNGSADNRDLISNTQACSRPRPEANRGTSCTGNALAPLRDRRDNLSETPKSSVTCSSATMTPNVVQRGDALALLGILLLIPQLAVLW